MIGPLFGRSTSMIYKLTDKVWWGDKHAVAEVGNDIKSVLNVSQNQSERYFDRLKKLPQIIPYFRLGRPDREEMNRAYLQNLDAITDIIIKNGWYPCLVHCVAGGHRSPAAAVYLAWKISGKTKFALQALRTQMLTLKLDVAINRPYHRSLFQYCSDNSVNG